jgi:hypothetical protein
MRRCYVTIRLSEEEKSELQAQADIAVISLSEYIRKRTFGHPIKARGDLRILAELRRQGGLLKHLYNETKGNYDEDLSRAIRANESFYSDLKKRFG